MSKESYARGFCKAAAAAGVDPVALAKYADENDVERYKKSILNAGEDAAQYLSDEEKNQPLPSVDDIRGAFEKVKSENGSIAPFLRALNNPKWMDRFKNSLKQEKIMPKEQFDYKGFDATPLRALSNLVRGQVVDHGGYISHREIPENVFRGAWSAFTNSINHGSAPVRPKTQQIILKK